MIITRSNDKGIDDMQIHEGKRYKINHHGFKTEVRVLSIDDDESCDVWVVLLGDCDRDMMIPRSSFVSVIV